MGRRVMIQGPPITMILFYCIKTATQPFSTSPPPPATPASLHLLPPLAGKDAQHPESSTQLLLRLQVCSLQPTGIPFLARAGEERVACSWRMFCDRHGQRLEHCFRERGWERITGTALEFSSVSTKLTNTHSRMPGSLALTLL